MMKNSKIIYLLVAIVLISISFDEDTYADEKIGSQIKIQNMDYEKDASNYETVQCSQ